MEMEVQQLTTEKELFSRTKPERVLKRSSEVGGLQRKDKVPENV